MTKALVKSVNGDDYQIHGQAVGQCAQRNRISESLHKDLEARFALHIQHFKQAKGAASVLALWSDAKEQGDVSGAFWAALTHPRCDEALQEFLLRDMHMLQHQAGAAVRVDMSKFNALIKENGVLARELGRAQERCTRVMTQKSQESEALQITLVRMQAALVGKETQIAYLTEDLQQLKASLPDYEQTERFKKRIAQLSARVEELERHNAHLRIQVQVQASPHCEATPPLISAVAPPIEATSESLPILEQKVVLCVGGRHGNVANYRELIERAGGRFTHHDGGLDDRQRLLDSSLAAADLVICQTGCINHNAYWRVKDFCKRHGKQCMFVENPSTSSLARCLQQLAQSPLSTQT